VEQDLQGIVIQETVAGKVLWENNYWKKATKQCFHGNEKGRRLQVKGKGIEVLIKCSAFNL